MVIFSDYMIDFYKKILLKDCIDRKWIIIKIFRKNSIRIIEFIGNILRKD